MIRIFPLGGCFVHHPVDAMLKKENKRGIFAEMGLKSGAFSLSANTNLQLVDFLTEKINFPEWIKNIVYSSFLDPPTGGRGDLIYSSDLALVGMSTPMEFLFEGALLNLNRFDEVVISELSGLAAERKLIGTWKGSLLRVNDELRKTTSEALYKLIPQETEEQQNVARFVRDTYSRMLSTDEMTESVAELRDRLGVPMALVLYNFMFMPDGRPVQWPAGFKDNCVEVARRLNLRTLDYAPFVAQEGVEKVLMDDRRHYHAPYYPKLGEILYDFCAEVLDRPELSTNTEATIEPEPAETSAATAEASAAPPSSPSGRAKKAPRQKKGAPAETAAPPQTATVQETAPEASAALSAAGGRLRYAISEVSPVEFEAKVKARKVARVLRVIEKAWTAEDFAGVARGSRDLLELEADNADGLIYLARAAAFIGDWADVARTGAALTRLSPRDAFVAAGKLNRAGRSLEAARIFAELEIREDWFDAEAASMARKDAQLLLAAGMAATEREDGEAAQIIWVAGSRIAPQSQYLTSMVRQRSVALKSTVNDLDLDKDPAAYISAYREMLWLNPSNILPAVRLARAYDRSNPREAIDAWLTVLAIDPEHKSATILLRRLAGRQNLEDHVIRALLALGRDQDTDPLLLELISQRDAKARADRDERIREALRHATSAQRDSDPEAYLQAWKNVLALDPTHLGAAKRVIGAASQLGDYPTLVDTLITHLEIMPSDTAMGERLAAAALRAGQEQRVLEYLVRRGPADILSKGRLEGLRTRVFGACRSALIASDYNLARIHFRTLALVDDQHPSLESLGLALANGLASSASEAEKRQDFTVAVLLAEQALEIVPDHPLALTLVARDFWRDERFGELVEFCQPRVKSGPAYDAVQMLLERAQFAA